MHLLKFTVYSIHLSIWRAARVVKCFQCPGILILIPYFGATASNSSISSFVGSGAVVGGVALSTEAPLPNEGGF